MYDIIKRYVDNENKNGLMLIDMPTGSGKTYSAIKYIFDACMDPQNKDRKYIMVVEPVTTPADVREQSSNL